MADVPDWAGVLAAIAIILNEIRKAPQTAEGLRHLAEELRELLRRLREE